jgi:hypothetical protein
LSEINAEKLKGGTGQAYHVWRIEVEVAGQDSNDGQYKITILLCTKYNCDFYNPEQSNSRRF